MEREQDADAVLAALAAAIEPADNTVADALRAQLAADGAPDRDPHTAALVELAARLAAAQHSPRPQLLRRHLVVCAADHGLAAARAQAAHASGPGGLHLDPSVGLVTAPTSSARTALAHLATGHAAVNATAHAADAALMLVDCGTGGASAPSRAPAPPIPGVLDVRVGQRSGDIRHQPAMTLTQAERCVQTGAALLLSLAETGLDVVGLGQLAIGARAVSGAVIAALAAPLDEAASAHSGPAANAGADEWAAALAATATRAGTDERDDVTAALARHHPTPDQPLAVLAALGGFDIGVMAGVVLAAASIRVPVVLDDHGPTAAALLAARWQPAVRGYLFAAHAGTTPAHRLALRALALEPLYAQAVSQGEGAGAALALPLLDQAASLAGLAVSDPA